MEDKMIYVVSATDSTVVLNVPDIALHRVWTRRGQKFPFKRDQLELAFYNPSVEYLFKERLLQTDDKQFLVDVGLISEEETPAMAEVDEKLFMRIIKLMPMSELRGQLSKLTHSMLVELGEYAVVHYKDLQLDRIDLLSKATGKNLLKAIELYKAGQEE